MKKHSTVALGLALAAMALPAAGQGLMPMSTGVADGRLCTAVQHPVSGWWSLDGLLGNSEPGGGTCIWMTGARLKLDAGGLQLQLDGPVSYGNLSVSPPALPVVTMRVIEPALCENYYTGTTGASGWNLQVDDVNDNPLFQSAGVTALDYATVSGTLALRMADVSVAWVRCHSPFADNVELGGDDSLLFEDGFESGTDLRIEFLQVASGTPISGAGQGDDWLDQPNTPSSNVDFRVRVVNVGSDKAFGVRVREFAPVNDDYMNPTVEFVDCTSVDPLLSCDDNDLLSVDIAELDGGAHKDFILTRRSTGTLADAAQALIQVAAFSNPETSPDVDLSNNSRSLRIHIVDKYRISHSISTTGGGTGGTLQVSTMGNGCEAAPGDPNVTLCDPGADDVIFTATAFDADYTFMGFSGCVGTSSDDPPLPTGGGYEMAPETCTLVASFKKRPVVHVQNLDGSSGSIELTPSDGKVHVGEDVLLEVNYAVGGKTAVASGATVNGAAACSDVSWDAAQDAWRIADVQDDCGVSVSYTDVPVTINILLEGDPEDSFTKPSGPVVKAWGESGFGITIIPGNVRELVSVTDDCGEGGPAGDLVSSNLYFFYPGNGGVKPDGDECEVTITFAKIVWTVDAGAGDGDGSFILEGSGVVTDGEYAYFNVAPGTNYYLLEDTLSITDHPDCGDGNVEQVVGGGAWGWRAGPITGDNSGNNCRISADFSNQYTVNVRMTANPLYAGNGAFACYAPLGGNMTCSVDPDTGELSITGIEPGQAVYFDTLPDSGYAPELLVPGGCNFQPLSGQPGRYRQLSQPANNCTVEVGFAQ